MWSEGKQSEIRSARPDAATSATVVSGSGGDSLSDGFEPFITAPAFGLPVRREMRGRCRGRRPNLSKCLAPRGTWSPRAPNGAKRFEPRHEGGLAQKADFLTQVNLVFYQA